MSIDKEPADIAMEYPGGRPGIIVNAGRPGGAADPENRPGSARLGPNRPGPEHRSSVPTRCRRSAPLGRSTTRPWRRSRSKSEYLFNDRYKAIRADKSLKKTKARQHHHAR